MTLSLEDRFTWNFRNESLSTVGIHVGVMPLGTLTIVNHNININQIKVIREYRYYKAVFQGIMTLVGDLGKRVQLSLDTLIFDNIA